MPPTMFFFLMIALTIQGLLYFHKNFRIVFSISVENAIGILIGIALNLQMDQCSMDILIILIISIHEYGISFQLFVSSLVSFLKVLQFSVYRSFTSLVKFIPKYFIVFDAIVNGIVFLYFFSDSLLLVYRNTIDFCMLILYPSTLLNSLICSKCFW